MNVTNPMTPHEVDSLAGWRISAAQLRIETFSSRIWDVWLEDGTRAVIKHLEPFDDVDDELRGVHYLSWRGTKRAIWLLPPRFATCGAGSESAGSTADVAGAVLKVIGRIAKLRQS